MSLIKKPVFWAGVLAIGAIGWIATAPEAKSPKAPPLRAAKKPSSPKKVAAKFTQEDFDAKFAPVNIVLKDSFQPVVMRTKGRLGSADGLANAIPTEMTGGDSGWVYTGTAEIDGVQSALIENRQTGEGVFLKRGERWRTCVVTRILPDGVVLKGPAGDKVVALVSDDVRSSGAASLAPMRVDVPQNLRGAIGGNDNARNRDRSFRDAMPQVVQSPMAMPGQIVVPSDGGAPPPMPGFRMEFQP